MILAYFDQRTFASYSPSLISFSVSFQGPARPCHQRTIRTYNEPPFGVARLRPTDNSAPGQRLRTHGHARGPEPENSDSLVCANNAQSEFEDDREEIQSTTTPNSQRLHTVTGRAMNVCRTASGFICARNGITGIGYLGRPVTRGAAHATWRRTVFSRREIRRSTEHQPRRHNNISEGRVGSKAPLVRAIGLIVAASLGAGSSLVSLTLAGCLNALG